MDADVSVPDRIPADVVAVHVRTARRTVGRSQARRRRRLRMAVWRRTITTIALVVGFGLTTALLWYLAAIVPWPLGLALATVAGLNLGWAFHPLLCDRARRRGH